jgi:hypothetical protein
VSLLEYIDLRTWRSSGEPNSPRLRSNSGWA